MPPPPDSSNPLDQFFPAPPPAQPADHLGQFFAKPEEIPPPAVPTGLPDFPSKAAMAAELPQPSVVGGAVEGAADHLATFFGPAVKAAGEAMTAAPRIATAEIAALPKQIVAGIAQAHPDIAKPAAVALATAGEAAEKPLLHLAPAGHPLGQGWAGALYEGGAETLQGFTSPSGLAMLVGLGYAPGDAQAMIGGYFSGQMASTAKLKFEEAWKLFQAGDMWGAKKSLVQGGLSGGMSALPLIHGRVKEPTSAAEVIAKPAAEAETVAKTTGPAAPPEMKAAAAAPHDTIPSENDLAALRLAEIGKGHVTPDDVPVALQSRLATRRNLLELAGALDLEMSPGMQKVGRYQRPWATDPTTNYTSENQWYGVNSMLPKPLQQGFKYSEIAGIIQKGLSGEEMTPRQQRYFSDIYNWARKSDGPLSPLDLEVWINDHGLSLKTPSVLEQVDREAEREAIQTEGSGSIHFDPTLLESRPPAGVSKDVVERTPNGDEVRPLMPPDPDLRLEANRLVRSIAGGDDQATAEALGSLYGIQTPIMVARGAVRVPETRLADQGTPTEHLLVRLPPDAEPYQLAHEIMYEGRKALQKGYTLPEHDDNAVAARLIGDLREQGLGVTPPKPPEPQLGPPAPEGPLKDVRAARNLDVIQRATELQAQIPIVTPFVEQSVIPAAKAVFQAGKEVARGLVGALSPRTLVDDRALDPIMKRMGAISRQQAELILNSEYARFQQQLDWLGKDRLTGLIDAIKDGKTATLGVEKLPWYATDLRDLVHGRATSVDLKRFADLFREIDQSQYAETDALLKSMGKSGVPWIDNHLRLMWKVRPSQELLPPELPGATGLGRRPLEGTGGFLKKMVFQNLSEGLKFGGEPVTYNPAVLGDLAWTDMAKLRGAMTMLGELKQSGFVKFVARGDQAPDGWRVLDDKISRVYFPAESGEGMVHAGNYYWDPAVHRVLSNYLGADVIRNSLAGRGLLAWKNITTATELAYSTFHAVVESVEAMGTAGGLALERFAKAPLLKKPEAIVRGIADWATAPARYARAGNDVLNYIRNPDDFLTSPGGQRMLSKFGNQQAIADAVDNLFTGGLKVTAGQDYRLNTARTFAESLRNAIENPKGGDYIGVALRAFPFVNETVMKPLFNEYIPRLKLGAFLEEYGMNLERNSEALARGDVSKATLARRSVDRIEDRFGEMNFDNLFWNRTFKSAMQYVFRSVTWKLGNVRAVGRGIAGQADQLLEPLRYVAQKVQNREITAKPFPALDPDMAWVASVALTTATLGTIIQKLVAKQFPWETNTPLMDAFMPRSGGVDENGKPNRILLPSYVRDWISAQHNPGQYLVHGLSSTVGRAVEAWNNRDFYGNEVFDDRHPLAQRLFEGIAHAMTPAPPFSFQGAGQAAERGTPVGLPFGGMNPAPKSYQETPWESYVSGELGRKYGSMPARRPGEAEVHDLAKAIRERAALGLPPNADVGQQRLAQIYRTAKAPPLEQRAAALTLTQILDGWHLASPEEQQKLMPILQRKASAKAIANLPEEQREPIVNRIREIFGGPAVQSTGATY